MNANNKPTNNVNGEDERRAARLTAHALGQLESPEQAQVEAELARSPQAQEAVQATEALAAALRESARQAPLPERSDELREAVERRLQELEAAQAASPAPAAKPEPRRGRPRWAMLAIAATLLLAALPAYLLLTDRDGRQATGKLALSHGKAAAPATSASPSRTSVRKTGGEATKNSDIGGIDIPQPLDEPTELDAETLTLKQQNPPSERSVKKFVEKYADEVSKSEHRGGFAPQSAKDAGFGNWGMDHAAGHGASSGFGGRPPQSGGWLRGGAQTPPAAPSKPSDTPRGDDGDKIEPRDAQSQQDPITSEQGGLNVRAWGSGPRPRGVPSRAQPPGEGVENVRNKLSVLAEADALRKQQLEALEQTVRSRKSRQEASEADQGASADVDDAHKDRDKAFKDSVAKTDELHQAANEQTRLRERSLALATDLAKAKETLRYYGVNPAEDEKSKTPPAQKHVETWKPSRLVPNTSRLMVGDREELPLKGMQVDVRVDGFRARVVLDLYYLNDRPQQLEGSFQLRLPEEATPYFFAFGRTVYQAAQQPEAADAMFFKREQVFGGASTPEQILALRRSSWEEPKVARMVPKEKAAFAYRETVRRRVDPALVEWAGAGVFQCRVFPLAPQAVHRVVIGYDVDLVRAGDDLELQLDLPQRAPACVVDFNIAAESAKLVSLDAPATKSADGQRLSYRLVNPQERPLVVRLHEPGNTMLVGGDGKTGNFFAVRMGIPGEAKPAAGTDAQAKADAPSPPAPIPEGEGRNGAIFLVDTSLSAGPQFPLWTKLMRAVLENNRDQIKQFAVLFFNVETFWWQEKYVANTPENVAALMQYADGLTLEGATDLGRALAEAAAPTWRPLDKKLAGPRPEMFLLSDGAGTWGEDRWEIMAAALRSAKSGPLFAYQTGSSGSDPRMLAHLAQETGGAVFAVVGEAEIARASTAQRQRPWQLAGADMAGGHDLLVAGRPQFVFPGQQLLLVGRCQPGVTGGEVRVVLQQGDTTQTVRAKIDRVLVSEMAARTYGQVAVGQLEDAAAAAATAESVERIATGYARHFRVTGRTCSLLMLESEQDYARFNIKPEEDDFMVSDRPAAQIVARAAADSAAALSDPKANFLAWFRGLQQTSGVHFDLPASLTIALEGLPPEAFAVTGPPLRCQLHERQDLPENVRQALASGAPEYEDITAESERRLACYGKADALRALSSLVEEHPGDAAVARGVAFSALEWERPADAYHLLRRAGAGRTFEPLTFHVLAHCLEQSGNTDLAIVYYELACGGQWDSRFGDMHNIAQFDYFRLLRRLSDGQQSGLLGNYARARLATLEKAQVRDTADLVTLIFWNTDGTDVDLHVTEPSGEECFYMHRQTASGGHISQDVTTGYGPEMFILPQAPLGNYLVRAHYFATDTNRASTRTKVLALIYQGWGTKSERLTRKALTLSGHNDMHELARIAVGQ